MNSNKFSRAKSSSISVLEKSLSVFFRNILLNISSSNRTTTANRKSKIKKNFCILLLFYPHEPTALSHCWIHSSLHIGWSCFTRKTNGQLWLLCQRSWTQNCSRIWHVYGFVFWTFSR
jgi:hypothetical protein